MPAGSLQVSAIISDIEGSSDWNFSRRSGRSQRSAREWARKSSVGHSGSQLSDAVSPGNLEDNAGWSSAVSFCGPKIRRSAGRKSVSNWRASEDLSSPEASTLDCIGARLLNDWWIVSGPEDTAKRAFAGDLSRLP